ncbi:MAG: phage/plasmid primase, P4 family [Desulfurococcaceae archaeon]
MEINEHKLKAVFGNCYTSLTRGKKYRVSVVCAENDELKHLVSGVEVTPPEIDYLNLDSDMINRIKFYVFAWDYILERREAEIYLKARIKVVPKTITDRELLAETIAKEILKNKIVKTFIISSGSKDVELGVYCYDGGHYRECEEELRSLAEKLAAGYPIQEIKVTRWVVDEALEKIKRRTQTAWEPAKHKLLFKDKTFDWDKFKECGDLRSSLVEPSPETYVEHRIPWRVNVELWENHRVNLEKYIPPKTAEDIITIFKTVSPKSYSAFMSWVKKEEESEDDAKPKVVLLLEVIGYTLYPHDYPYNKAVLLVGEGSNGKSTYLKLIKTILGERNVSSVNLKDLDTRYNKFAAAELYGKLANISTEPVKGLKIDMTQFKQLTGEDLVRFERKFKDGFAGHNYAKMIFSANELPEVTEDTYAFWRRWIVIEFPNTFEPDPEFFKRTFTPEEVEGIILCSLHAFRLVLQRNEFTTIGAKDPKEEWMSRSNPVYKVVKKMLEDGLVELNKNGWVVKEDLYELYKAYVNKLNEEEDDDLTPVSKKKFTEELEKLFPIKRAETRVRGKHLRTYLGITIKDREKAEQLVPNLETPYNEVIR